MDEGLTKVVVLLGWGQVMEVELYTMGEAEVDAATGQTVVETATTEVTIWVSVMLSGCAGQLVTVGWHEVMVLVWVL